MAKFNAMTEQAKLDSIRVAAEERQKILQEEAKLNKQKALYEDELARRRYVRAACNVPKNHTSNLLIFFPD